MRGYTLIELIIAIGIIAIVSTAAFLNLSGYAARRDLELATRRVAALFRDAQSRSVTQEDGMAWGVHIAGNQFQLLKRSAAGACGSGSQSSVVNLGVRLAVQSVLPVAYASDICFNSVTGFLTAAAAPEPVIMSIGLISGGGTPGMVKIYNNGRIE